MTLKCEDARVRDTGVGTKGNGNADVSLYAEQNPNLQVLTCARLGCNNVIEQSRRGRRQRFCSAECRVQAFRSRAACNEKAEATFAQADNLNAPAAFSAKRANFVTSKINVLATTKNRGSVYRIADGIVGPQAVIRAELINGRNWEEVVSTFGVVSYVSRIAKRALVDLEAP